MSIQLYTNINSNVFQLSCLQELVYSSKRDSFWHESSPGSLYSWLILCNAWKTNEPKTSWTLIKSWGDGSSERGEGLEHYQYSQHVWVERGSLKLYLSRVVDMLLTHWPASGKKFVYRSTAIAWSAIYQQSRWKWCCFLVRLHLHSVLFY